MKAPQVNTKALGLIIEEARGWGYSVVSWTPGDGWTRYRVVHLPSLPSQFRDDRTGDILFWQLDFDGVRGHEVFTGRRHEVACFLLGAMVGARKAIAPSDPSLFPPSPAKAGAR